MRGMKIGEKKAAVNLRFNSSRKNLSAERLSKNCFGFQTEQSMVVTEETLISTEGAGAAEIGIAVGIEMLPTISEADRYCSLI